MNTEAVLEIHEELSDLEREQKRLLYYVSLLDERQARVVRLYHFERKSWEEIAGLLEVSARTAQKSRSTAVERLAELYSFTAGVT